MKQQSEQAASESTTKLDIMLEQVLPSIFNINLWQLISAIPSAQFMKNQEDIMNILLSDFKLFQSFFPKFYSNHQHLNNWYMLANSNQQDIKKYVFTQLLSKKFRQYRQIIKDGHTAKRYNNNNQAFRQQQKSPKQRKKQSFHKIHLQNVKNRSIFKLQGKQELDPITKLDLREDILMNDAEKQDYHELFLKTFSACDGSKYIYYDFNKHMRGIMGKNKYNDFIRIRKHKKCNSNTVQLTTRPDPTKTMTNQQIQSYNSSVYLNQNKKFLHQGQGCLQSLKYCSISMDPIGQVQKKKYIRQVILLRKTAGGLKKIKPNNEPHRFQLKKKIL